MPETKLRSQSLITDYSVLGYAEKTSNQASITTEVDITGLSVAVTVPSGARVKITGFSNMESSVDGDYADLKIYESTTQLTMARGLVGGSGKWGHFRAEVVLSPSAGSHTYKIRVQRATGTGNITLLAGATYPAFILVEII